MSDPHVSTGNERVVECQCGSMVTERESQGAFLGAVHWRKMFHDAPCGLPCLSGGVRPKAYRMKEFHRDDKACSRCKPGSDPTAREVQS